MNWTEHLTDAERAMVDLHRSTLEYARAAIQTLRRRANKRAERRKAKDQPQ